MYVISRKNNDDDDGGGDDEKKVRRNKQGVQNGGASVGAKGNNDMGKLGGFSLEGEGLRHFVVLGIKR